MKKLNVLQLCHNNKGPFVPICAMYLKALTGEQHQVHTVFLRGEYNEQHEQALSSSKVHFLNLKAGAIRGLKLGAAFKIANFCKKNNIDIIIAHRYKAIYIAGLASILAPVKVWGVAHTHNVFSSFGRKFLVQNLRKNIKLIAVSRSVENDIKKSLPKVDCNSRIFSIPNALDDSIENEFLSRSEARNILGIDNDAFVFGTIGRLVGVKAHDILLKAFADSGLHQCQLVIIGDGKQRESLQQLSQSLGIDHQVVFAGQINNARKLIKAFDAFVFPSYEGEAFGLAALEGMAAGIPVVCSDASGPLEVVGDSGLVFKQGDITQLSDKLHTVYSMTNPQRTEVGVNGYDRWQQHYTNRRFNTQVSALLAQK